MKNSSGGVYYVRFQNDGVREIWAPLTVFLNEIIKLVLFKSVPSAKNKFYHVLSVVFQCQSLFLSVPTSFPFLNLIFPLTKLFFATYSHAKIFLQKNQTNSLLHIHFQHFFTIPTKLLHQRTHGYFHLSHSFTF